MDTFTRIGAARLATKIKVYWASLGLNGVSTWTEPFTSFEDGSKVILYCVKSNIPALVKKLGN